MIRIGDVLLNLREDCLQHVLNLVRLPLAPVIQESALLRQDEARDTEPMAEICRLM